MLARKFFKMSQSFHPEGKSDSENETSSFSELEIKFGFKFSQEINSPYTISLENSPSNSPSNSPFLEETTEDTTAGSSRKRKGEKPIKSKEAKKAKLISKEKGKNIPLYIYILF